MRFAPELSPYAKAPATPESGHLRMILSEKRMHYSITAPVAVTAVPTRLSRWSK